MRMLASSLAIGSTLCFCGSALAAENAVLLEGFEQNIDAAVAVSTRTTLNSYTSQPEAAFITQGSKSLEVTISETEWWSHDFDITLSEDATKKIRDAVAANAMARYILRFDFIFPTGNEISWMNCQVGGFAQGDQLDAVNTADARGTNTMSIPLDLIGALPEEGQPVVLQLNLNFDAKEDPFTSIKMYVDNIRLVDTYAPGASPVVYTLQDFENSTDPIGGADNYTGWGGGTRTSYAQFTSTDTNDLRVSHGTHSLKVSYTTSGWMSDFYLPLDNTKLAEILKLDSPAEERPARDTLGRYTLRFETIYPARAEGLNVGSWINTSYSTTWSSVPWSQGGGFGNIDTTGFPRTMSVTLDQIASWADNMERKPGLMFVCNGDWADPGIDIYYDNFRLIDTGAASTPTQPQITSIKVDAQKKVVITWTGGGTLQSATTLASPTWTAVTGAASGQPIDPPSGGVAFYRVQQ